METYEITEDQIIQWALDYAGYEELEKVAKGIYAIYVERRKKEYPENHKKNKLIKKSIRGVYKL